MGIARKLSIYGKNTQENTIINTSQNENSVTYLNHTRKYLNIIINIIQNKNIIEY